MNRQNSGKRDKREREKEKEASRLCRPLPKLQARRDATSSLLATEKNTKPK